MELGRECLKLWGYERVDEIIWVKTNQLQRIIRTGRTGHWLNHGKEHCLVSTIIVCSLRVIVWGSHCSLMGLCELQDCRGVGLISYKQLLATHCCVSPVLNRACSALWHGDWKP